MGVEAYRFAVNIEKKENKLAIKEKLLELGGILISEDVCGRINIDFCYEEGIIEVLMENPYEIHKGLRGVGNISNVKNQLRVYMRIAKPNSEKVIDKLMVLLSNINCYFGIKGILDLITGKKVDVYNYTEFKDDFIKAKIEFETFYSGIPYPIKCNEVFPKYREIMEDK
jgi:hypothetical protein